MKKILILFAHPAVHKSRINRQLIGAVEDMENVTVHDLYEHYPDFHINIKREQELLLDHDIIVWHHPFYWYSSPSLLKEWIDLVLQHGFAYGRTGKALQGKKVMTAISTGGRKEAYMSGGANRYSITQLLAPFRQTVQLCNMEYLPPFVVHGSHMLDQEGIAKAAEDYKKVIRSLRDEIFSDEDWVRKEYLNDLLN